MKNLEKEIKKMKNLYSYNGDITLLESIKLNETLTDDLEIGEQVRGVNVRKSLSTATDLASSGLVNAFKEMETAIGLKNNPIRLGRLELRTADQIFDAIKNGSLQGKELGRVEKGLLRAPSTTSELRKAIIVDWVKDKNVLKELSQNAKNSKDISKYLKDKGYAKESIDEIIKQMKSNGTIDAKGVFNTGAGGVKPPVGGTKNVSNLPKEVWDTLRQKLKQKTSWKKLLLWGAGLGITGAVLWNAVSSSGESLPDDFPKEEPLNTQWAPCIAKLITDKRGVLTNLSDGSSVVKVTTEEYPSGVYFYDNGNAYDVGKKVWGKWKCKGGQVVSENELNEQIDSTMSVDVDKMVDLLDFPVSQSDLKDAYVILKKYTDSGKGKKFLEIYQQAGTGGGDLNKTLKYIYTQKAESVQYKNEIKKLINQIESGSGGTGSPSTGGALDDIEITWGGGKSSGGGGSSSGGGGSSFKSCSDFPFTFGCKNEIIKEVQKCLGMEERHQTGNFGPITLKYLETKRGENTITKQVYDDIMKICKQSPSTETPATGTETPATGTETPSTGTETPTTGTETPTTGTETPTTGTETPSIGQTPTELYNSLIKDGYLFGRLNGRRVVYKGPDLSKEDEQKLISIMNETGYRVSRSNYDYRRGDKIVFKRNKVSPEETQTT
jgi:hypothetical protein